MTTWELLDRAEELVETVKPLVERCIAASGDKVNPELVALQHRMVEWQECLRADREVGS